MTDCEQYDPDSDTWVPLPPMNVGSVNAGMAALGSTLYLLGGLAGGIPGMHTDVYLVPTTVYLVRKE